MSSPHMLYVLQRVTAGKRVTKAEMEELHRDGLLAVINEETGEQRVTPKGTALLKGKEYLQ